ncbi:MAG: hypothetical protein AAFY36_03030 [Bacteroidota bacterium]
MTHIQHAPLNRFFLPLVLFFSTATLFAQDQYCGGGTIYRPIVDGNHDVEIHDRSNPEDALYANSSDLEMVTDHNTVQGKQEIGLKFTNIFLPANAVITNAYIEFTVDDDTSEPTDLVIDIDPTASEATFQARISQPPARLEKAYVRWFGIPAWDRDVSPFERTPDLSGLIQAYRSGLRQGNPNEIREIMFWITGTGSRSAKSFEGGGPPVLHIEYKFPCRE